MCKHTIDWLLVIIDELTIKLLVVVVDYDLVYTLLPMW